MNLSHNTVEVVESVRHRHEVDDRHFVNKEQRQNHRLYRHRSDGSAQRAPIKMPRSSRYVGIQFTRSILFSGSVAWFAQRIHRPAVELLHRTALAIRGQHLAVDRHVGREHDAGRALEFQFLRGDEILDENST